jgi:hypothetical protein
MWSVTAGLPVRVNAQLIDGAAGWANRFEENVADVFKLQDQAVARLAAETSARLMETKRSCLLGWPGIDAKTTAHNGIRRTHAACQDLKLIYHQTRRLPLVICVKSALITPPSVLGT